MPNRAIIQAKRLLDIRTGPGSLSVPAQFTALELSFAQRNTNGHMGPRKFAQINLPRIQFRNPNLEISVKRIKDPQDLKNEKTGATMTIKSTSTADSKTTSIKGLHSDEILKKFIEMTGSREAVDTEGSAVVA